MELLSHSQLNGWTGCGERYRLERVVGVPQTPAWALIGGSTVHEVTEHDDLRQHGVDVPALNFEETFERLTVEAEEKSGLDRTQFRASGRASRQWPDKENAAWWLENGPAMVDRWTVFARNTPWVPWTTPQGKPAIEISFQLVNLEEQFNIRGAIDRVYMDADGNLIVVDIKTGASKQSSHRQLGTYKVAVEDLHGVAVSYGSFWDARSGVASSPFDLSWYTPERLAWTYRTLKEVKRRGMFLPNPGPMCGSCSVRDFCYEQQGWRAGEVPMPWETTGTERIELEMEPTNG